MVTEPVTRPYDGPGDDSLPDPVQALPQKAKEIWVAAYNSAYENYDAETSEQDSQEGYANAVAWGAVNQKFKKNEDGEWVSRSYILSSYEAPFSTVKRAEDEHVAWRSTISDDGVDKYATRMTTDLHESIIANASSRGMPFLTIAHFNRLARVGRATRLWRDGRRLKAEGVFFNASDQETYKLDELDLSLAGAASERSLEDIRLPPGQRQLRTSIGLRPAVGGIETEDLGVIGYTSGWIPEIAITTRPGNSRVDFAVTQQRSADMSKVNRLDPDLMEKDAAEVVGKDLASRLRKKLDAIVGRSDDDTIDLIYRSLAGDDGQLEGAALIAAARVAKTDGERLHLTPLLEKAGHTPPWARKADRLADRLEDLAEAETLRGAELLAQDSIDALRASLAADILSGEIKDFEGCNVPEMTVEVLAAGEIVVRSKWGDTTLPIVRVGRRLQGTRLQQLSDAAASLDGVSGTLRELVDWASADVIGNEMRSVAHQTVAAAAAFAELFTERLKVRMGDVEPDDSLIETMELHQMTQVVFEATYTLSDIIVANLREEEGELTLDQRMQNVQNALDEFSRVVNSLLLSAFGGGRSAPADNTSEMSDGKGPKDVKPGGDGTGAVNAVPASPGQPDLQSFDGAVQTLRQVIVEGSEEDIQAALNGVGEAIVAARPSEEGEGIGDVVVERVAGLEVGMSTLQSGLNEILSRLDSPATTPTPPAAPLDRSFVPRRRSLPAGPVHGEVTPAPAQVGHDRPGMAKRFTIAEAIDMRKGA